MTEEATKLSSTIVRGNLDAVKELCSEIEESRLAEVLVNTKIEGSKKNVLHVAASRGTVKILRYLMELVSEVGKNETDGHGFTVLHRAAFEGGLSNVKYLWELGGIDVDKKSNGGWTPLDRAAFIGRLDCVKYLYEYAGADIYIKDNTGSTPLHAAVERGQLKIVDYFLQIDSDYEYKLCNIKNNAGKFPLDVAIKKGSFSIVWQLVDKTTQYDFNTTFSEGNTLLHMAITEQNFELFKYLSELRNIKILKNDEGKTPFDVAINTINSPLTWLVPIAYKHESFDIVTALLKRPEIDVDEKTVIGWFDMMRHIIIVTHRELGHENNASTEVLDDLMNTFLTESIVGSEKDFPEILVEIFEHEKPNILQRLRGSEKDDKISGTVKSVLSAVLNIVTVGLLKYIDHEKLRYVFLKPNIRGTLIQIFLDKPLEKLNSKEMTTTLNLVYTSFQASNDCKTMEKDFVKDALRKLELRDALEKLIVEFDEMNTLKDFANDSLEKLDVLDEIGVTEVFIQDVLQRLDALDITSHENEKKESFQKAINRIDEERTYLMKFERKLNQLAQREEDKEVELNDVQLMSSKLIKVYFEEREGCCYILRKCYKCFEEWFYEHLGIYHRCIVRGYFALFPCMLKIWFHVSDIVSDILVGLETFHNFSERLGRFMISLAGVTLFHENIRSVHSQYETEEEVLRVKCGRHDINKKDWDESDMNYYNGTCSWFCRAVWPFKVNCRTRSVYQNIRAVIFNGFSLLMLRPVVDRLKVVTHTPTNLSTIYRQKSNERSLNQYYMVLEQIPELLIQFYVFQIFHNNIRRDTVTTRPLECLTSETTHTFNYSQGNSTYFDCSPNLLGLEMCAPVLLIYSMTVPFFRIPYGMVCLEELFRKLDPYTPKMSSVSFWLLYLTYILMIPSRLFLYSGILHVTRPDNNFILYVYVSVITLLWSTYNLRSVRLARKSALWTLFAQKEPTSQVGKLLSLLLFSLSLLLFSFRDIWTISLRDPIAYISSPSTVTYSTLRSGNTMMVISSFYFVEGLVGAVCIQQFYPCGMKSEIFRYQGWLWLFFNVISASILILLSYMLQPRLKEIVPKIFKQKRVSVGRFLVAMIFFSSLVFVVNNFYIKIVLISILAASVLIYVLISLCMSHFGEAKVKKEKTDAPKASCDSFCKQCSCSCFQFGVTRERSGGQGTVGETNEGVPLVEVNAGEQGNAGEINEGVPLVEVNAGGQGTAGETNEGVPLVEVNVGGQGTAGETNEGVPLVEVNAGGQGTSGEINERGTPVEVNDESEVDNEDSHAERVSSGDQAVSSSDNPPNIIGSMRDPGLGTAVDDMGTEEAKSQDEEATDTSPLLGETKDHVALDIHSSPSDAEMENSDDELGDTQSLLIPKV